MNIHNNPTSLFVTCQEYKYMDYGINKPSVKTCCDKVRKEENTAVRFPCVKNRNGVTKLVASTPDDQALWEL
jgi:hypothetical protein